MGMAYILLGVGLHGHNGLDAAVVYKIITAYITPRLLYGLDGVVITRQETAELDKYYR